MKPIDWKHNLSECSARCTIAAALVCTASGGLRAQEIKPISKTIDNSTALPTLSTLSRNSTILKTSAVSVQKAETSDSATALNISNSNIAPSKDINYSWTSLNSLSVGKPSSQSNSPLVIAKKTPVEDLIPNSSSKTPVKNLTPNPSSQSLLAQSTQSSEAKPTTTPASSNSDLDSPEFPVRLYLGPDFFYRDYNEEKITPDFKSQEFGTLFGLQTSVDYVKANSVYFGIGFRYGGGQTNYRGGQQVDGENISYKGKTDNQFLNLEGRLGYTFQAGQKKHRFLVSPFVALGYHQWNRDTSSDATGPSGPVPTLDGSEKYSWGYIGPGFHAEYKVSKKFTIGLNAKLMFMFGGKINVENTFRGELVDQGSGKLGNDLQYEIELPLTYNLVENSKNGIDLKFTPYYRSQDIARGQPFALSNGGGAVEPASTTSVYGATVGVQLRF
jgi:hypothetical protein